MSEELADNLRRGRRALGWSQEDLAHHAGLSVGPIRSAEQGKHVRMETLHTLAMALDTTTSALMGSGPLTPVAHDDPNKSALRAIRTALMPGVELLAPPAPPDDEPDLRLLRRMTHDKAVLYAGDSYGSVAAELPPLVRAANEAVRYYSDGDQRIDALVARSEALQLVGRYLTQVRQFDLAHTAIRDALRDAQDAEADITAGSAVGGLTWVLLRTERFGDAEAAAVAAMDRVEPKIKGATPDQYATWGGLAMEAAAAAVRDNRPEDAKEHRKAAKTAAAATGTMHRNRLRHWSVFGPSMVAMKALEDLAVVGDSRGLLRKAQEEEDLQPKTWERRGYPSPNDLNRHRLDLAGARARTGDPTGAVDILADLVDNAPEWVRHQSGAAVTLEKVTSRRRTLTTDMRRVASHLGLSA